MSAVHEATTTMAIRHFLTLSDLTPTELRQVIERAIELKRMQRRDKAAVDRISATILLQGFMESRMYEEMKNR